MYCVIFGAGIVGSHTAEILERKGYRLAIVDQDTEAVQQVTDKVDARPIIGNIISHEIHEAAETNRADLVLCVTNHDAENFLGAMLAKKMGAKKVIARTRSEVFYQGREDTLQADFGIDEIICPETLAAKEIAKRIKTPGVSAIEFFANGRVGLREHTIPADSKFIGLPFHELDIMNKVLVTAIFRKCDTIIPHGDTSFEAGDHFFVIGKTDELEDLGQKLGDAPTPKRKVIIYGGTPIGSKLAMMLEQSGIAVKLIEPNKKVCSAISERLKKTLVLNGSGLDPDYLVQSGIAEADAFIAAGKHGEHNIVSALIAAEQGAPETIAVVQEASFLPVARRLGVHAAISPRLITASQVVRTILPDRFKSLAILSEHEVDVLEVHTLEGDKIIGKELSKVQLPKDTVIASIVRGDQVIIPHGNDSIHAGDTVIVFTLSKNINAVERMF